MIYQNIWKTVVGSNLINISSSSIFPIMLSPVVFHSDCQAGVVRYVALIALVVMISYHSLCYMVIYGCDKSSGAIW